MIDAKYCYTWDWDKGPMTYNDFIECLRKDLDFPKFTFHNYPVPENEEEYQQALRFFKSLDLEELFK